MVRVTIGDVARDNENISERWINQQISRRNQDGAPLCVKVEIDESNITMGLSSPACVGISGGTWQPNHLEEKIYNLWVKHKLDTTKFHGGDLIAFLKQADIL